jgi:CubicO group peptidase (beta-lactamase class C family)
MVPDARYRVEFDEKRIDAIFATLDQGRLPGAMAGIAIRGKPVYRKGFGLASLELPVVLSPTTRLRLGSTTKHFAALAYLLLCEEGRAGIDDPIGKYLPEINPASGQITMRQLMTNTSGLRDATDVIAQFCGMRTQRISTAELLSYYRDIDDVNFAPPGTGWIYNNGGWILLSVAIERIADQSFEEVMRERIFNPVGMYDTEVRRWDSDFYPNSASTHAWNPAVGRYERLEFCGGTDFVGAGAIISTIDDMLRWMAHMDAPKVASAASWELMKSPQILPNGTSTGYGFGLQTGLYRGVETLWHGGGGLGSNTQMLKVPRAGLDVEVMVNSSRDVFGVVLATQILDACLPALDPVKRLFSGPSVTGTFRSPTTGRVVQLFGGGGQQLGTIGANEIPFEPDDRGVLRPGALYDYMKLEITMLGDPEKPASIRLSDFGNTDELVRLSPPARPDASAIAGRYLSATTGTHISIVPTDEGARLSATGRYGSMVYDLECLAQGVWRTKPTNPGFLGGLLSFDRDAAVFRYSNLLTRDLPFRRVG